MAAGEGQGAGGGRALLTVSVVIPFRGDGLWRDRASMYVWKWWRTHHPDWQTIMSADIEARPGPWCKGREVASLLRQATGDLVVVADADVLCPGVAAAVDAVGQGAPWAMPHRAVYRLHARATTDLYVGADLPDERTVTRPELFARCEEIHKGAVGGGMVVLRRETIDQVPIDPRFTGWGQEDLAWGLALTVLTGPPWQGTRGLWHLWHPPEQRLSRTIGSSESAALYARYRASCTRPAMTTLVAEYTRTTGPREHPGPVVG